MIDLYAKKKKNHGNGFLVVCLH